jgi:RNA polymerase sigma factor (sigma-70 family)
VVLEYNIRSMDDSLNQYEKYFLANASNFPAKIIDSLSLIIKNKARKYLFGKANLSDQDLEDIVIEAITEAWKNRSQYRQESLFSTWFFTIMKRVIIKRLNVNNKQWGIKALDENISSNQDVEKQYEDEEFLGDIADELTEKEVPIFLQRIAGDSEEEIARNNGISKESVKQCLKNGRKRLRQIFPDTESMERAKTTRQPKNQTMRNELQKWTR